MNRLITTQKIQKRKQKKISTLVPKIPESTQNPLLSTDEFFKYCKERFENIGITKDAFLWLLNFYKEEELLTPVYSKNGVNYYSTFQVYNLYKLEQCRTDSLKLSAYTKNGKQIKDLIADWQQILKSNSNNLKSHIEKFNKLLVLLFEIQDFYLPELRSNRRLGEFRNYGGSVAIGGTYFSNKRTILLSSIRKWRNQLLKKNEFNPKKILSDFNFSVKEIERWIGDFSLVLEKNDPLIHWHLFLQYINYDKRQKLKGSALLAQDFNEIAQILFLFLKDLGEDLSQKGISEIHEWFDTSARDKDSNLPHWKERKYGKDILNKPYQMLEFLCNEFGINPKPRAVIFTEGEEWKAVKKLFEFYDYDPSLLGIEFRSIQGEGNFSLANWQCFIEYMHEKQVLIYFVLDNEGQTAKQARRLLKAKRKFDFEGLKKVIPRRDRITIWGARKRYSSFEEANFTNADIAKAVNMQVIRKIKSQDVESIRKDPLRKRGLIGAIEGKFNITLNKPQLDIDLVTTLIEKRQARPNVKQKTPIENFVLKSGELILLNHQPTGKDHQKMNLETGLLG